jgi:hypothetical protein
MVNPNNNKHFNDEALRINRTLKKENDSLKETIVQMQTYEELIMSWWDSMPEEMQDEIKKFDNNKKVNM